MSRIAKFLIVSIAGCLVVTAPAQPSQFWARNTVADDMKTVTSDQGDTFCVYGSPLTALKIDRNGVVTKGTSTGVDVDATANYIKPTPDGGVAACISWAPYYGAIKFGVVKFGPDLDFQWILPDYGSSVTDESWNGRMCVDALGNIFVLRTIVTIDSSNHVHWTDQVDKISPSGTPLWSQTMNLGNRQQLETIDMVDDGAGGVWTAGTAYLTSAPLIREYWAHFDGAATCEPFIPLEGGYTFYLKRQGSSLYLAGTAEQPFVRKIDAAGSSLWRTDANMVTYDNVWSFAVDTNGSSYIVSSRVEAGIFNTLLARIAPDGTRIYSRDYGPIGTNHLLPDNSGDVFVIKGPGYQMTKILPNGDLAWPNLPSGTFVSGDPSFKCSPSSVGRDFWGNMYIGSIGTATAAPGKYSIGASKFGPANNAAFVGQSAPSQMVAGQTYWVSLSFNNVGLNPWSSANNYYLKSQSPAGNTTWGRSRVDLGPSESIENGQARSFGFYVNAPMTGGNYGFQWRLAQNTGSFGMPSNLLLIPVVVRQHAARYISQTLPSSVKAGSTFSVSVTMRNVGTNPWTKAGGYALRAANGYPTWEVSSVALGSADSIARGGSKTFTFTCVAPATPGTYAVRWQMHRAAPAFTGFFGDMTTNKSITVTP